MQTGVRRIYVEDSVRDYAIRIVHGTRTHPDVVLGASPRGSIALVRAAQAHAALHGRDYVVPDDVKALAPFVLSHRIVLKPESRLRGRSTEHLVEDVLRRTPVKFEEEQEAP